MFCPYLDRFVQDCNQVLTFQNLSHAMTLCTSDYTLCPIYAKLQAADAPKQRVLATTAPTHA